MLCNEPENTETSNLNSPRVRLEPLKLNYPKKDQNMNSFNSIHSIILIQTYLSNEYFESIWYIYGPNLHFMLRYIIYVCSMDVVFHFVLICTTTKEHIKIRVWIYKKKSANEIDKCVGTLYKSITWFEVRNSLVQNLVLEDKPLWLIQNRIG